MSQEDKRPPYVFAWRKLVARTDLTSTPKSVAQHISLSMNERGAAFPSTQVLAQGRSPKAPTSGRRKPHASLSDRAVRTALDELVEHGWLRREERPGTTTIYTATVPFGWHAQLREELERLMKRSLRPNELAPFGVVDDDGGEPRGGERRSGGPEPRAGEGVNDVQGGPEPGSPEVDLEEDVEVVHEDGGLQLSLEAAPGLRLVRPSTIDEQPIVQDEASRERFDRLVGDLGLWRRQLEQAWRAFEENEVGFERCVREARRGERPGALLMARLTEGHHRGGGDGLEVYDEPLLEARRARDARLEARRAEGGR